MKIRNQTIVVILFCLLSSCFGFNTAQSQSENVWNDERCGQLDELLQKLSDEKEFSGTVLLAEDGEIQFQKSYGYSDIRKAKKLDRNASFRLASVSKQFTAMGIMLLKTRGKLNYDDAITKYLPALPYKGITIRHLLNHTGGLPDYMSLMGKNWEPGKSSTKKKLAFNKDMVAQFEEHQPDVLFEPGSKFQYSNTGYVFLGHLIEVISGQPVQDFFSESVFHPLKMEHSHIFSPSTDFAPDHRVYGFGYRKRDPGYREHDYHYLNGMVGDGGVYSSAEDLLKWDQALYGDKLIPQTELAEAFQSGKLGNGKETGYGFGWSIDVNDGTQLKVSHGGSWVGFITYIARNVTEKRTLIILTNNSTRSLGKVKQGIREIVAKGAD